MCARQVSVEQDQKEEGQLDVCIVWAGNMGKLRQVH
jgi:hypothetical protein